jgi:hypothetical protein
MARHDPEHQEEEEISWLLVRPGLAVHAADGASVGRVTHVLGDPNGGIFHGVAFRQQLWTAPRVAQAVHIARITNRALYLKLRPEELEQCPPYQEDPLYRVGRTGLLGQSEGWRRRD